MSILTAIDTFFCQLEGNKNITPSKTSVDLAKKIPSKATIELAKKMATEAREAHETHLKKEKTNTGLGSILHRLFVSPEYNNVGLEGWKDDKEKFKLDLLNDIKNFLFTKWEKPWRAGLIFDENNKIISGYRNISGRVYKNSSNVISLAGKSGESPYFVTIKKLAELGGKILDATKQVSIISFIPIYKEAKTLKGDKVVMKPDFMLPKFHPVINVDFVEGIKKPVFKQTDFKDLELNEYVENFIKLLVILKRIPKLHYDQADRAYYTHSELTWKGDSIHLAPIRQFKNIEGYYSVLFHEITHSTMNPERCGRGKHKNASLAYANEELVAEMGAMIICSELGLNYNRQNSLSYLKGWLSKAGKSNEDAMIEAYAYACDAADYLMKDINFEKLVPKTMVARAKEMEAEEVAPTKTEKYTPIYKVGDAVSMFDDEPTLKVVEVNTWTDKAPTYDLVSECGEIKRNNISETKLKVGTPETKLHSPENSNTILPRTKPDELSYQLGYDAYRNVSFDPEKRAKQHQESFAKELNEYAEMFEAEIKSDEQKDIAIAEFSRFKQGYKDKYIAWLRAKSKCISSMITGGSNFPVKRAEKANQAEHNRVTELLEWEKKASKAIIAKIKGKTPKDVADAERWAKLKKELAKDIATIIAIDKGTLKGYSKNLFVASLKRLISAVHKAGQFANYTKALELVKDAQEKYKVIIFAPVNSIWKLEVKPTENSPEPLNKDTETLYKADGCEVVNNYEAERVQMAFNGKPAIEIIATLKKNAFKWSPSQKVWQRQNTTNGINAAMAIAKKFFPSNEPTPEPQKPKYKGRPSNREKTIENIEKNPPTQKPSNKVEIIDTPIKDVYTDEKRFQNRSNSFSEDSKTRIIKAVENGSFNWAKFDPILLWLDPSTKRNYVLSGHSRFAAFKELAKTNKAFSAIPSRFFTGTEAQAIDAALNSNTLSTKETEVERAMYYAKQRNTCELKKGLSGKTDCEKQVETSCKDAEGKNANYILNLSYLNPEGFLIDNLNRLGAEKDNDSTNLLRTIANWIGEARRNNPELSNSHETEIAQFLLNGGYGNKAGQFKNKAQFNERLDYSFNKWKAGGAILGKPLNLANTLNKSSFEREFDERLAKAKEAMDEAIQEHEEKYKKYLFAVMDGSITQPRMDELMKPIIAYVKKAKTDYERIKGQKDDVIKAASAQTSLWGINGTKNFGLNGLAKIKKAITQKLSGDLGEFLGEFDRNCYTIVLRGDKGAGKSRLLFQLINAFAHKKFRAAFLCLEMAKNSSVTMRYKKEYISRTNLKRIDITDIAPTYDELNQICKQYDVVAIDSWTKLKGFEQKDFDRLQKENPSTIIIAVFQSTTGKVVRGGNMPEYDAGTVIQVNEGGLAECEKNRYAATDKIFNVFDKKLQSSLEPEPLTNV